MRLEDLGRLYRIAGMFAPRCSVLYHANSIANSLNFDLSWLLEYLSIVHSMDVEAT